MDQKPAQQLNTAYQAYLHNPTAAQQTLQAAAQGAPTGLRGLAAAAAQQTAKDAQMAQAGAHRQGPQPSVIQQLAMQGAPGIMGQLPSSLQLASAPTSPAPAPQMMAGGGLVAFADGGNVLPPDVIDAIQSHFAAGGEIPGYAAGDEIMSLMRGAPEELPYGEMGSFMEGPGATPRSLPADYGPMGSFIEGAPKEAPSKLDLLKKFLEKETSIADIEAGIASKLKGVGGKGLDALSKYGKAAGAAGKIAGPLGYAYSLYDVGNTIADPKNQEQFTESWQREMPTWLGGRGEQKTESAEPTPEDTAKLDRLLENYPSEGAKTWKPEPHDGHEVTPRPQVPAEGQKVSQEFKAAKQDVPSAAVTPTTEAQGLAGLDSDADMLSHIKSLLGEKTMSPEIAQKLADLEGSARTSTIFQTLLGGLAGGLSNPYGGRFALGSAALNALAGYQKGTASEDEMARKAFDIQRAYADQPAEVQTAAAKELFDLAKAKAQMQSAERVAEGKALSREDLERWKEEQRLAHPEVHGAGAYAGITTPIQQEQIINMRRDDARKEIEDQNKDRAMQGLSPLSEQEKIAIYARYGVAPSAGQTQPQYGAGASSTGRSIVGGKLTGSSPQ